MSQTVLLKTTFFLSALLLAASTLAQKSPYEGWYQIEMIVFARPLAGSEEQWPKDITLDYPLNWQHLRDPEAEHQKRLERARQRQAQSQGTTPANDSTPPAGDAAAPTPEAATAQVEPVDLQRSAFYHLPKDERALNAAAQRIDAQSGFRVLFHQSWRQNVVGEDRAPWVLIKGGDEFGEHRELEGSININVSRYLHLATDLWFSEFEPNAGQSRNQWPQLPENPLKRLERLERSHDTQPADLLSGNLNLDTAADKPLEGVDNLLPDFIAAPYLPKRIYTMDQRRRMRSRELHHLDHPRLGLLIEITPYEIPPEPEPEIQPEPAQAPLTTDESTLSP